MRNVPIQNTQYKYAEILNTTRGFSVPIKVIILNSKFKAQTKKKSS